MSRNKDEDDATLRVDDKSNVNNSEESSKTIASTDVKLEDHMKRVEKLTAENNKLRKKVKAKRTKGGSFSSGEEDLSYEEEDSKKGKNERNNRNKPPITQCPSIMIICLALPPTPPYPLANLPTLMEVIIINGSIA
jgi:seryl-tRNA synthetase